MTVLPGSRRADAFERAVARSDASLADPADAELVGFVAVLERARPVEPRAEFAAELRIRLMAAAETELHAARSAPQLVLPTFAPSRLRRRLAAGVAAMVVVGASAGVATAAQSSIPGQALYPVKRGLENARIALDPSATGRGHAQLGNASARIDELERMLPGASAGDVRSSLRTFTSQANAGSDVLFDDYAAHGNGADITAVRSFARSQLDRLTTLRSEAPAGTQAAFAAAAAALADLDQQARTLCSGCDTATALSLPSSLVPSSSGNALTALVADPAAPLPAEALPVDPALAAQAKSEAKKAAKAAKDFPTPTAGAGMPTGGSTGGTLPGPSASAVTQPVNELLGTVTTATQKALQQVTDPVNQTVQTVTGLVDGVTGGAVAPVVDPVTGLVTGTLDTLSGKTKK